MTAPDYTLGTLGSIACPYCGEELFLNDSLQ